jgi:hypothetical protein
MTLEGQQSVIVNIDSRKFQIIIHDTAGNILIFIFLGTLALYLFFLGQ